MICPTEKESTDLVSKVPNKTRLQMKLKDVILPFGEILGDRTLAERRRRTCFSKLANCMWEASFSNSDY